MIVESQIDKEKNQMGEEFVVEFPDGSLLISRDEIVYWYDMQTGKEYAMRDGEFALTGVCAPEDRQTIFEFFDKLTGEAE